MLRLSLLWVDKTREAWLREGLEGYIQRLRHYVDLQIREVRTQRRSPKMEPAELLKREAESLKKALPERAHTVALDVGGRMLDSPGLARFLTRLEEQGVRDLAMLVGGPLGLAPDLVKHADERLSLSPMTLPHDLARLVLAEQLYRAFTIRAGEPYHH